MTTDDNREEQLRHRAAKLGYDLDRLGDGSGYYLARIWPGLKRTTVFGDEGGVTLDQIEKWLDDKHPAGGSP